MKKLLALTVVALGLAAFTTTAFAGKCCSGEGEKDNCKDKQKVEEGAPS